MKLELTFETKRIADLLCSAFEGGSNYWYEIVDAKAPKAYKYRTFNDSVIKHLDYPCNTGGNLTIKANDDTKTYTLNLDTIQKGLEVFAKDYPRHFGDWIAENDDAETGDVFLQCCLFGKVIYG